MGSATDSEDSDSDFGRGGRPQFIGRTKSIEVSTVTTRRAGMYSPSESGSDYPPYQQQARPGLTDTPSSGMYSFKLVIEILKVFILRPMCCIVENRFIAVLLLNLCIILICVITS